MASLLVCVWPVLCGLCCVACVVHMYMYLVPQKFTLDTQTHPYLYTELSTGPPPPQIIMIARVVAYFSVQGEEVIHRFVHEI